MKNNKNTVATPKAKQERLSVFHEFLKDLAEYAAPDSDIVLKHFQESPDGCKSWGVTQRLHVKHLLDENTGFKYFSELIPADTDSHNWYVSLCTFPHATPEMLAEWSQYRKDNQKPHPKSGRTLSNATGALGLVIDDCDFEGLPAPSAIVQTSADSQQYFYFFRTSEDAEKINKMLKRLTGGVIEATGSDKSGNNAVRWVRPPYGVNTKEKRLIEGVAPSVHLVESSEEVLNEYDSEVLEQLFSVAAHVEPRVNDSNVTELRPVTDRFDVKAAIQDVLTGASYHDALLSLAGYYIALGTAPAATQEILEQLMLNVKGDGDTQRWQERVDAIPESIAYCVQKRAEADEDEEGGREDLQAYLTSGSADVDSEAVPPEYLLDEWLEADSHGLLYAPSQALKSFAALHMAHCIATGQPLGRFEVDTDSIGNVVFIIGEGRGGYYRRVKALILTHGKTDNIHLVEAQPNITDQKDMMRLRLTLEKLKPKLIVIDTFSSLAASIGENDNSDVAKVMASVRDLARSVGASSMVIHHSGKDADRGARGASSFFNNADFVYSMRRTGDELCTILKAEKMKDGDIPAPLNLKFKRVDIQLADKRGNKMTSLALDTAECHTVTANKDTRFCEGIMAAMRDLNGLASFSRGEKVKGPHYIEHGDVKKHMAAQGVFDLDEDGKIKEADQTALKRAVEVLKDDKLGTYKRKLFIIPADNDD